MLEGLRDRLVGPEDGPAVEVRGLTETFRIYQEKPGGLKERLYRFRRPKHTDFDALKDVTFQVAPGEAVGVVGHNGSGKSTLLKVLARILPPDEGEVVTRGRVASLLELGAGFHGDLTGRENIFLNGAILGMSRADVQERFEEIVEFSEVGPFLDTAVRNYSSGMYVRLGFAIAVTVDPDVLLVDEVLSVGDAAFQQRSLQRMRRFHDEGKTLLVVSHDLAAIAELCERVIVLDRGRLVFDGNVGEGLALYDQLNRTAPTGDEEPATGRHRAVRITDAVLTDRAGDPVDQVTPGTELELRITVSADDDVPACSVGVRVDRGDGTELYETHSAWHGLGVGPLSAGDVAVVLLRLDANLLAGHHRLRPLVSDASARFAWAFGPTVGLDVAPRRGATGVVDLGAAFSVGEGPALRLGTETGPREPDRSGLADG